MSALDQALSSPFMPHGHCYLWTPSLVALQVGTNLLIGLAYLFISLTLVHLVRRIKGLPFEWVYLAFGTFIIACGVTHFMDVLVIWRPAYWLDTGLRVLTAVASAGTAVLVVPLVGRVEHLVSDARARQRLEEELRQTEERFRLIVESVEDYAIFMLDPDGRVLSWSPGATRLLGYRREEAVGQLHTLFYTPEAAAADQPARDLDRGRAEGRYEVEGWRVRKDGTRFFANVAVSAIKDPGGRLLGFAKVSRDVTDRMRAEALAREHGLRLESLNYELAALLETLFQTAPIGLGYLDRELRFVRINDHLAQMDGQPVAAHLGRTVSEVLPALPEVAARMRQVLETGEPLLDWEMGDGRPGGRRWLISYYPVVAAGQALGLGVLVQDITFRKQAEAERERLLLKAEEGVRTRDVFLAVAAHELRTPLTPLRIEIDRLLRAFRRGLGEHPATQVGARLVVIERQLGRLERLVGDLLDASRIAAGRSSISTEEVDLIAMVREIIDRHAGELAGAGSEVSVSSAAPVIVGQWDRARLEQVVTNLLGNAIKYGEGKPIRITLEATGETAGLSVSDSGIGIPQEDQARIFDRFERAASERHYGGLGLGLWIVREALAAMGGTVAVRSVVGQGSTFTMQLPRQIQGGP